MNPDGPFAPNDSSITSGGIIDFKTLFRRYEKKERKGIERKGRISEERNLEGLRSPCLGV